MTATTHVNGRKTAWPPATAEPGVHHCGVMTIKLCLVLLLLVSAPAATAQNTHGSVQSLPRHEPAVRSVNGGQLVLEDVPEIPPALVQRMKQFQNVRSARFLDWTEDGKGMYVKTRFGTLDQIHRLDAPGAARHQITYFEEHIGEVQRQAGGATLALTLDRGGSEFGQIYLLERGTANGRMVTDGESRNTRLVWDRSGQRLAYQSTLRDGRSNDIWMMDVGDPATAQIVLQATQDDWWSPVDFTGDGRFMLVQQLISATDSRVHLLNLGTGELQRLSGDPEFSTANRAVVLDREDQGYYLITNARGLAAELAWQPLDAQRPTRYISTGIAWDVTHFALSPDGRRGAFTTNEGGISRLYLLNTRSGNYSLVENMPVGLIFDLEFHPDNHHLAMTLNTAKTPSDAFVMQLGRSPEKAISLQRWTFSEVGGLDTERFVEPRLIRYPTFDLQDEAPREIPAFVYTPPGRGPFPVVIHIHGGPESQYQPEFSSTFQMWLAELGVAVIAPNVRGSSGYGNDYLSLDDGPQREDAVKDIGALLDWIATQPELDATRVAVHGSSYGGYMVLASAVHYGDRLKAAVDVVGISNFVSFLESTQDYRRDLRRREYGDEREPGMRALLQQISPLTHADRIDVPLLVVQGQNDPRVALSESTQIVQALRRRGRPVWYINALNEGHGYERKDNQDVYQQAAMLFLQRYLLP